MQTSIDVQFNPAWQDLFANFDNKLKVLSQIILKNVLQLI